MRHAFQIHLVTCWLFFICTGAFIALTMPIGEGFDEPWHITYIQQVAEGTWPRPATVGLSPALSGFFERQPIGWAVAVKFGGASLTEYWQQSDAVRAVADQESLQIGTSQPGPMDTRARLTETHQPPLYYAIAAPIYFLMPPGTSLVDALLLLRVVTLLIASLIVPLVAILARKLELPASVTSAAITLTVLFPGLYPGLVRIANDALTAVATLVVLVAFVDMAHSKPETRVRTSLILGVALMAGLLSKAFFVPMWMGIVLWTLRHRRLRELAIVFGVSLAGWLWSFRNYAYTGSLTGLPESLSAGTSLASTLAAGLSVDWWEAFKQAFGSHIWTGNYALLGYRSWMYQVVQVAMIAAITASLIRMARRPNEQSRLRLMLWPFVPFLAGLGYYATQVYQATGQSIIQGWYLSSWIPVEAILFVSGLWLLPERWQRVAVCGAALSLLSLLIYGTFFIASPHYGGQTLRQPSGHVETFHPQLSDASLLAERLVRLYPWLSSLFVLALATVVAILGVALIGLYAKASSSRSPLAVDPQSSRPTPSVAR